MVKNFTCHDNTACSVKLLSKGCQILTGSYNGQAALWCVKTGRRIRQFCSYDDDCILSVALSQDERYILTASADKYIQVWNLQTGKPEKTLLGHKIYVNSVDVSADLKYIVSGCYFGEVK